MVDRSLRRLYRELKRRRVFRVVAAYAVVAFAVVEAADVFFPALGLPGWALTLVAVAAILGFPLALFLAWAFDIGPGGLTRTEAEAETEAGDPSAGPPERWHVVAVGAIAMAAVVGGAFLLLGGDSVLGGAFGGGASDGGDPGPGDAYAGGLLAERIAVLPLENQTGDPELDPVGRLAADWISQGVSRAGIGQVMPLSDILRTFSPDESVSELSAAEAAAATGAGTVVAGSYYRVGGELQFQARVLDTRRNALIHALDPITADTADPRPGIERLREQVTGILATVFDPREIFGGSSRQVAGSPPTLEAYREYADGLDRFLQLDLAGALPFFHRAARLDPSFRRPTLRAVEVHWNYERWERVDSLLSSLEAVRSELSRPDRLLLEAFRAQLEGDRDLTEQRYDQLARMFPNSYFVYAAAWQGLAYNDPRRTLRWCRSVDPARGPMARWAPYWGVYAGAHHRLRDYQSELEVVRRARREFSKPEEIRPYWEFRPLAALGRFSELREALDREARTVDARTYTWLSRELQAHGHADTAAVYLAEALERYGEMTPEEKAGARRGLVNTLYRAGRFDSARVLQEAALAEAPEPVDGSSRSEVIRLRGRLGTIAARQGKVAEARRIEEWLAALDWKYTFGAPTLWRARIAAVLGEHDRAVSLLRDALRRANFYPLHTDPDFLELRDHPGFQEVLRPEGGWADP